MNARIYFKHLGKTAFKTGAPILVGGLITVKTGNPYYFLGGLAISSISVPYYLLKIEDEFRKDLDNYINSHP